MWLAFNADGSLGGYSTRVEDAPPAGAVVFDLPTHLERAAVRACQAGRVTRGAQGRVHVDGAAWSPPAGRPALTYAQILAAVDGLAIAPGAKTLLGLVAELLLEHGKVEL